MNESIKNLLERRSIRAYKKELVPKETLDTILEAGEYSPSGMGQQSTLMVVTQDPELVARLSKMNAAVPDWKPLLLRCPASAEPHWIY